eukprot:366242-Chlamydomonas_euryale.AAC.16
MPRRRPHMHGHHPDRSNQAAGSKVRHFMRPCPQRKRHTIGARRRGNQRWGLDRIGDVCERAVGDIVSKRCNQAQHSFRHGNRNTVGKQHKGDRALHGRQHAQALLAQLLDARSGARDGMWQWHKCACGHQCDEQQLGQVEDRKAAQIPSCSSRRATVKRSQADQTTSGDGRSGAADGASCAAVAGNGGGAVAAAAAAAGAGLARLVSAAGDGGAVAAAAAAAMERVISDGGGGATRQQHVAQPRQTHEPTKADKRRAHSLCLGTRGNVCKPALARRYGGIHACADVLHDRVCRRVRAAAHDLHQVLGRLAARQQQLPRSCAQLARSLVHHLKVHAARPRRGRKHDPHVQPVACRVGARHRQVAFEGVARGQHAPRRHGRRQYKRRLGCRAGAHLQLRDGGACAQHRRQRPCVRRALRVAAVLHRHMTAARVVEQGGNAPAVAAAAP